MEKTVMDKAELLIEIIDRTNTIYEELIDLDILDPVEIEDALEYLKKFQEELETLIE
jgi:hypothetical protein